MLPRVSGVARGRPVTNVRGSCLRAEETEVKLVLMGLACVLATCTTGAVDRKDPGPAPTTAKPATAKPATDCGDAVDQRSMNECFCAKARSSQALLDELLKELNGALESGPRERMDAVQRTWVAYRDGQCAWEASLGEGGSIQPTIRCGCLDTLTWSRIAELKIFLCEGFGMTGDCEASNRYAAPAAVLSP